MSSSGTGEYQFLIWRCSGSRRGWERGQDQASEGLAEDPIYRTVLVANETWTLPGRGWGQSLPRRGSANVWPLQDIVRDVNWAVSPPTPSASGAILAVLCPCSCVWIKYHTNLFILPVELDLICLTSRETSQLCIIKSYWCFKGPRLHESIIFQK